MFDFRFDPADGILHIAMARFWSAETMADFSSALIVKAREVRGRHGPFATLIDLRHFPIQSPTVTSAIQALMQQTCGIPDGPIVTVTGSALAKLQASRILCADNSRVYLDWDEAVAALQSAWLPRAIA